MHQMCRVKVLIDLLNRTFSAEFSKDHSKHERFVNRTLRKLKNLSKLKWMDQTILFQKTSLFTEWNY